MNFTLNGKKITVVGSWQGLNFAQYLRTLKMGNDMVEQLSIITGIEPETLRKANIKGLDKLLYAASFMSKPIELPEKVTQIGKYKLPVNKKGVFDIQMESLAQFEDMRQLMMKQEAGIYAQAESYATYCAIYLQKIRDKEYNGAKALEMVSEVMEMPALEVITAGSFFFVKLMILLNGMHPNSQNTAPKPKKHIGRTSKKRSGRTRR